MSVVILVLTTEAGTAPGIQTICGGYKARASMAMALGVRKTLE
jgi:hypothetical protein